MKQILPLLLFICSCSTQPDKTKDITKQNITMNFRASFCDPFKPEIIELVDIPNDSIISKFENTNWKEYLQKMETAKEDEIFYSPSLEIENKETKHGLAISAVGNHDNFEFYIFYKRPKKVKALFGLKEKVKEDYTTNITGQTKQNVLDCLNALIRNDTDYLANKIGQ